MCILMYLRTGFGKPDAGWDKPVAGWGKPGPGPSVDSLPRVFVLDRDG